MAAEKTSGAACVLLAVLASCSSSRGLTGEAGDPLDAVVVVKTVNTRLVPGVSNPLGWGSGFYADPQGHIITNHHVVEAAVEVWVLERAGVERSARVLAADPVLDLALLEVPREDASTDHHIDLRDAASARVGLEILCVGAPVQLSWTTSFGRIGYVGRILRGNRIVEWLQVQCIASHGSSGSPVLTPDGRFVGVLARQATNNENIGFVVPAGIVADFHQSVTDTGKATYCWPGFQVDYDASGSENLPAPRLVVSGVAPDSPASAAGLRPGTQVVEIDHTAIDPRARTNWNYYLYRKHAGENILVRCVRDGSDARDVWIEPRWFRHVYPDMIYGERASILAKYVNPYDNTLGLKTGEPRWAVFKVFDSHRAARCVGDVLGEEEIELLKSNRCLSRQRSDP